MAISGANISTPRSPLATGMALDTFLDPDLEASRFRRPHAWRALPPVSNFRSPTSLDIQRSSTASCSSWTKRDRRLHLRARACS